MKSVFVALFAVITVASAQKFFFSDLPTQPAGVPAAGFPSVPGTPGFNQAYQYTNSAPAAPSAFIPAPPPPPPPAPFSAPAVPGTFNYNPVPVQSFAPAPAAPVFGVQQQKYIPIIEQTQVKNQDGSYNIHYETANGIAQQENSQVALNAKGEAVLHRSGSYGYTAPDGTPVSISYIADEHGFRVSGQPLPVAPQPLPVAQAAPFF